MPTQHPGEPGGGAGVMDGQHFSSSLSKWSTVYYLTYLPDPSMTVQGRRTGGCTGGCFLLWVTRTPLSCPTNVAGPQG